MINQQWLTTFMTLVELGHFTKTANILNMTQPGVSQHLKKLEEDLGFLLIKRIGKSFELTLEGEALYKYGKSLFEREKTFLDQLSADDPEFGECRFACSGSLAMTLYPKFLLRQKELPGLNIKIEAGPNSLIHKKIKSGEVDLGLVTNRDNSSVFDYELVGKESLCLILPKKYVKERIDLNLLLEIGFIDHPDGEHYLDRVLSSNFKNSYKGFNQIRINSYVNQIGQILLPVTMGLGFTVLPISFVKEQSRSKLFIMELNKSVADELYIVTKKNKELPSRYDWFLELLRSS